MSHGSVDNFENLKICERGNGVFWIFGNLCQVDQYWYVGIVFFGKMTIFVRNVSLDDNSLESCIRST